MALNSLICADVPLRNCSLTHPHGLMSFWYAGQHLSCADWRTSHARAKCQQQDHLKCTDFHQRKSSVDLMRTSDQATSKI